MFVEETFYRPPELSREARTLAATTMRRLQPEFHRALVEFWRKRATVTPARVIKLNHGPGA